MKTALSKTLKSSFLKSFTTSNIFNNITSKSFVSVDGKIN